MKRLVAVLVVPALSLVLSGSGAAQESSNVGDETPPLRLGVIKTETGIQLSVASSEGVNYQLQWSRDLIEWENDGEPFEGAINDALLTPEVPDTFRFWRVVVIDQAVASEIMTIEDIGLMLLPIPAGVFTMGTPDEGDQTESRFVSKSSVENFGPRADEGPQTEVTLTEAFWLGKTEVTQGQWEAMMGTNFSLTRGENQPAERGSWEDSMEFCEKLTEREREAGRLLAGHEYTLPTEAQWEYACRAGSTTRYSWGDNSGQQIRQSAWHNFNGAGKSHDVVAC